jgi:hypothetical protein
MSKLINYKMQCRLKNSFVVLNDEILYSSFPISKTLFHTNFLEEIKNNEKEIKLNEINSSGYRSDEFVKNHNGHHILFSGCSYTFGSGLLIDEVWSKRVYDMISKDKVCSGYFNLGVPGSSILNQITDIFKYCETYGNPDCIFLNIPDLYRFYTFDLDDNGVHDGIYDEKSLNILELLSFQYYLMLDQYCKSKNIKLFCTSWSIIGESKTDKFSKNIQKFTSFYKMNIFNIANHVVLYKKNNKNDSYAELSRDDGHVGNAYHDYWAKFIYGKYLSFYGK